MLKTNFDKLGSYGVKDVSKFDVQITAPDVANATNYHAFNLVGATGCKIKWGDGVETAWTTNQLYSHTYASAGTYTIQITGPHTRFYHQTGTPGKVIQAIRLYSGITSGQNTWYGCNNPLFHLHPKYRFHEGIITLAGHFANCSGMAFSLIEGLLIPNSCTSLYQYCISCSGVGFTALPTGFIIPSGCLQCAYIFYGCLHLVSDISNIFPTWAAGVTISLYNGFYNAKVTGTAPSAKLWGRTDITWNPSLAFSGAIYLTNYADIPSTWK